MCILIVYFFLCEFWKIVFQEISAFIQVIENVGTGLFPLLIFLYYLLTIHLICSVALLFDISNLYLLSFSRLSQLKVYQFY